MGLNLLPSALRSWESWETVPLSRFLMTMTNSASSSSSGWLLRRRPRWLISWNSIFSTLAFQSCSWDSASEKSSARFAGLLSEWKRRERFSELRASYSSESRSASSDGSDSE